MDMNLFTRRGFFGGMMASLAAPCIAKAAGADKFDRNLSVFLSDIHISGKNVSNRWGKQATYQNPRLAQCVAQVLAMRPLPARVVVFGDVANLFGLDADYAEASAILKPLQDAGIELIVTTGNHDHRAPMFKHFPRQTELTPIPGRLVTKIDLGYADFLLLDSLKENMESPDAWNAVDGALDQAQSDWVMATAKAAKRPFFIGCHHPPNEAQINGKHACVALADIPMFAGYIHGHNHRWTRSWFHKDYSSRHVIRYTCLPSTGWWGTIGFATMRTFPERAELALQMNDFYFPSPLKPGERRPPEWDEIMREEKGTVCTFAFS